MYFPVEMVVPALRASDSPPFSLLKIIVSGYRFLYSLQKAIELSVEPSLSRITSVS